MGNVKMGGYVPAPKGGRNVKMVLVAVTIIISIGAYAQDGAAGISAANTQIRGYFGVGTQLMYAIGALLGLIGAVKV